MKTLVGIFKMRDGAAKAADHLKALGFAGENVILLSPGASQEKVQAVPTEDTEQPGMGKALGSVVGGAAGLSAGTQLGSAVATFLIPGVGQVLAASFGAAAVLGVGGAFAGAAAGGALENVLSGGLPKDEIFFYEDALKQGWTVLIALADRDEQLEHGRNALQTAGAETLDEAREKWWIGLRDAEETLYPHREDFKTDEAIFRRGFEAALSAELRSHSYEASEDRLKRKYPDDYRHEAFRHGFERGQSYYQKLRETKSHP